MSDVPPLPESPPERFQFHIRHLLAFMLAGAFVALGLRQLVAIYGRLPGGYLVQWLTGIAAVALIGGLTWFFLRLPIVIVSVSRGRSRWRALQSHRRTLENWTKARQNEGRRIMAESDEPEGERGA